MLRRPRRPAHRSVAPLCLLLACSTLNGCATAGVLAVKRPQAGALANANQPPVIEGVQVEALTPGEWRLRATAKDPDGHTLTYAWHAAAGFLSASNSSETRWHAPAQAGPVAMTLRVSDGHGGEALWQGKIHVEIVKASDGQAQPSPTPMPSTGPLPFGGGGGGSGGGSGGGPTPTPFPPEVDYPPAPPVPTPAPTASTLATGQISSIGPTGIFSTSNPPLPGFFDGAVAEARFRYPHGLAADSQGYVVIADSDNHAVRRLTPWGSVHSVAGNGSPGYSGDDGYCGYAQLHRPQGIAIDAQDNIYIADMGNHVIRKIMPGGKIYTVAGTGTAGSGGDGGDARRAQLNLPTAIAVDAQGNLYIADSGNHVIRRVDHATRTITRYAGNGSPGGHDGPALSASFAPFGPGGLAVAPNGDLYIADTGNHRIRFVKNGFVATVAGTGKLLHDVPAANMEAELKNGPATDANLYYPRGLAFTPDGDLYVADFGTHQIRRISGGTITRVAGAANGQSGFTDGGTALTTQLYGPSGVVVQGSRLFVTEWGSHRLRMLQL